MERRAFIVNNIYSSIAQMGGGNPRDNVNFLRGRGFSGTVRAAGAPCRKKGAGRRKGLPYEPNKGERDSHFDIFMLFRPGKYVSETGFRTSEHNRQNDVIARKAS